MHAREGLISSKETQMATTIGNLITLDGQFTDWPAADAVKRPGNTVATIRSTALSSTMRHSARIM